MHTIGDTAEASRDAGGTLALSRLQREDQTTRSVYATGLLVYWSTGLLVYWSTALLVHWSTAHALRCDSQEESWRARGR